jgi:hypothetical protein
MASLPNEIKKFSDLEKDSFSTIAQANWQKAAQLLNYLNASIPVGMIIFVRTTQDALPEEPDPQYWQYCDGSAVVNALSPLLGQNVPDLRDKYIKHPSELESELQTAGSDTKNLQHSHGGFTGYRFDAGGYSADNDNEFSGPYNHRHAMGNAMSTAQDIKPQYRALKAYIRIV